MNYLKDKEKNKHKDKYKHKVSGIGLVTSLWSNTDISKCEPYISNIFKADWSAIIFVLDRDIKFNYPDIYKNEIKELLKNEKRLKELIKSKCKIDDEQSKKPVENKYKTKEYIILENNKHYNGTGSLNVALNYIRNHYKDKPWLWQFNDDDDNININKANNLINFILNPQQGKNKYKYNDKIENNIISIETDNENRTNKEISKYRLTETEQKILNKKEPFEFTTDMIINHSSATKTHLYKLMSSYDCNLWSFMFSPIYYDKLTCRLITFGREDLDMINYLMIKSMNEQGFIDSIVEEKHAIQFKVPNNLVRINGLFKSDTFKFYIHNKANDSGYSDLKKLNEYNKTIIDYMNNHLKGISKDIKEEKLFPATYDNKQATGFLFGVSDGYKDEEGLNYGIERLENKYITDINENILNETKEETEEELKGGEIKHIPIKENLKGELYIAEYEETIYNKNNIENNNISNSYNMFMNGKNIESNKYVYKMISYICSQLITLKDKLNKRNVVNINDDEIKELTHNYYNYVDVYTMKTNDEYNKIYSTFDKKNFKDTPKEYIKMYKQDNKIIYKKLVSKSFYEDINNIINILNINESKIFEELKYNQEIANIWNNIYFIYNNISIKEYKIKDILIHADAEAPTHVFGGDDNKTDDLIIKVSLICLLIIAIVCLIIFFIINIKRLDKGTYNINHNMRSDKDLIL